MAFKDDSYGTVEIDGLAHALRKFKKFPDEVQTGARSAIETNAKRIEKDQIDGVAIREKETRDAISIVYEDDGMTADIRPRGYYGYKRHWIEFGTAHRTKKKNGADTGSMPAQPFMIPSYEKNKDGYVKDLQKVLREL